jgi:hypothetical protein
MKRFADKRLSLTDCAPEKIRQVCRALAVAAGCDGGL